ncbi:MAG: GTPase Era [Eubacteriales bacterium]|nr:GTPase Era [Eubacteriales bacterium]
MQIIFHNKQRKYDAERLQNTVEEAIERTFAYIPALEQIKSEHATEFSVDVSFISKNAIRELNRAHRDIDRHTDILSFPAFAWQDGRLQEDIRPWLPADSEGPASLFLGDLMICLEVLDKQAEQYGNSLEEELFFLVVHGVLHLVGYDHELPADEINMKSLQDKIVSGDASARMLPCGYVVLAGRPNVGKSTLLNYLSGMTLAITTPKPQTTRDLIRSVYTDDDCQITFLDTPGFHKPKTSLGKAMLKSARVAIRQADVVVLMIEASFKPFVADLEKEILKMAAEDDTPVILLINKSDIVVKENILPLIAAYNEAYPFKAIIPITATTGDGVEDMLKEIKKLLPIQEALFQEGEETNVTERKLAEEMIRREVLMQTQEEVPFGVAIVIDEFTEESVPPEPRKVYISATILCDKPSHKGILVGRQGQRIKSIGTEARAAISEMLGARVHLELFVKVSQNWMNRPQDLAELGLDSKTIELP